MFLNNLVKIHKKLVAKKGISIVLQETEGRGHRKFSGSPVLSINPGPELAVDGPAPTSHLGPVYIKRARPLRAEFHHAFTLDFLALQRGLKLSSCVAFVKELQLCAFLLVIHQHG